MRIKEIMLLLREILSGAVMPAKNFDEKTNFSDVLLVLVGNYGSVLPTLAAYNSRHRFRLDLRSL